MVFFLFSAVKGGCNEKTLGLMKYWNWPHSSNFSWNTMPHIADNAKNGCHNHKTTETTHLFHTIQTCCRCVYPKGEMHWFSHTVREAPYCETKALTEPVSMSYISAPRLHQSTAFPWPVRIRISGALKPRDGESASYSASSQQLRPFQGKTKKQQKTKLIDSGRENGFCFMPVHTCVTECAWNVGYTCHLWASFYENVAFREFGYFVFTCMPGGRLPQAI